MLARVLSFKQQKSTSIDVNKKRNSPKQYMTELRMDRKPEEPEMSRMQQGQGLRSFTRILLINSWTQVDLGHIIRSDNYNATVFSIQ